MTPPGGRRARWRRLFPMRLQPMLLACAAPLALAATFAASGCLNTMEPPEPRLLSDREAARYKLTRPKSLGGYDYVESTRGDVGVIGCADGQREGFADVAKHPRIAGCLGSWVGKKSLRAKKSGKACGDDGDVCEAPADVCADGWHPCGRDGRYEEILERTSARACNEEAGPGKFVAAMSHGQSQSLCPPQPKSGDLFGCWKKGPVSEPICCGDDCDEGKCNDGLWPDATHISLAKGEGCASATSEQLGGLLCCYDADDVPTPSKSATASRRADQAGDDEAKSAEDVPSEPAN
jgi:hypothetical protein